MTEIGALWICRFLGVALILAVCLNFINVLGRYGFNHAFTGFDEVEIYLMVTIAFLGCLVAHLRRRHLRMDVLVRTFPPALARAICVLESMVATIVCCVMTWISGTYALRLVRLGNVSENGEIPLWIPHSVLAVAFGLMALVGIARLLSADFAVTLPHEPLRTTEEAGS